jgi:hypothetical protein
VKAAAGIALVRGCSGLRIGARWSGGDAVGGGDDGAPFYRVGGAAGRPSNRREWDGGGGGRFGRGSTGVVVGSDEEGCSSYFGSGRGRREAAHVHVHVRWRWQRRPFGPGGKDDRAGPTCQ